MSRVRSPGMFLCLSGGICTFGCVSNGTFWVRGVGTRSFSTPVTIGYLRPSAPVPPLRPVFVGDAPDTGVHPARPSLRVPHGSASVQRVLISPSLQVVDVLP
ncbi:hypothetical protein GDO86_014223 [Hymenochirus boettgeri]|uniref:Uncharacterized protein n=1 Tax=Hymenochirus boettgeri TaxID=247094 RepID=A0A8T2JT65_9PIPI|nr:hypothetical protein GDO86_014223 [Hymenochirus boettgeri]